MKLSHIYKVQNKKKYRTAESYYYLIKTKDETFLFTESAMETAKQRAEKNTEDLVVEEEVGLFGKFLSLFKK